jgi:hypothetical protein
MTLDLFDKAKRNTALADGFCRPVTSILRGIQLLFSVDNRSRILTIIRLRSEPDLEPVLTP